MTISELEDKIAEAELLMDTASDPDERAYYRAALRYYQKELNIRQYERELEEGSATRP